MKSLSVKNFRSIVDSGEIKLKPISIFLGKNSCGKSSFMRLLPLLKQTLESDVNEPLLWYGDYVDFGDFKNILPIDTVKDEIEVKFDLQISPYSDFFLEERNEVFEVNVGLKIAEKYIKELEIDYFDQKVVVFFHEKKTIEKIIINDASFIFEKNEFVWEKNKNVMIPTVYEKSFPKQYAMSMMYYYYYHHERSPEGFLKDAIYNIFKIFAGDKMKDESKAKFFHDISAIQSRKNLFTRLIRQKSFKSISQYFKERDIQDETFLRLNNLIVFNQLNFLIEGINSKLNEIFENTYYLKPIRVNAERYYRVQGITINKVDADGSNLPMIFYNMSEKMKGQFKEWCIEKFGLFFSVETSEGHVSLIVQDLQGNKSNLVDTGYGYSQVLPIIVQLWLLKNNHGKLQKNKKNHKEILLVIEQPELHLHPAFQSKLIEVFTALIQEMQEVNIAFKIVFETHSDTMINKLGTLINQGVFNKELVNVILVEKTDKVSTFTQVGYNDDGFIEHWPIGFMSAGY